MEELRPYLSYRERVSREFFVRGLVVPTELPLSKITQYCNKQCEKFCIGECGMYTISSIQLFGIFCISEPEGLNQEIRQSLIKQLKKED